MKANAEKKKQRGKVKRKAEARESAIVTELVCSHVILVCARNPSVCHRSFLQYRWTLALAGHTRKGK